MRKLLFIGVPVLSVLLVVGLAMTLLPYFSSPSTDTVKLSWAASDSGSDILAAEESEVEIDGLADESLGYVPLHLSSTADPRSPFETSAGVATVIKTPVTLDVESTGDAQAELQAQVAPVGAEPHMLPANYVDTSGEHINVSANGEFEVRDASNSGVVVTLAAGAVAKVYYGAGVYTVDTGEKQYPLSKPVRFAPKGDTVLSLPDHTDTNWNDTIRYNEFSGNISVFWSSESSKLWAINELPIESYVAGIAEADSKAAPEYLKVMSIIARSYAMHYLEVGGKHAGEPYDLLNSRQGNGNDQVYAGYSYEKQVPTVVQSVSDTVGLVVTYNGAIAKTPYSAGTDGKTRSAEEVWGADDLPYCIAVEDPHGFITDWATLTGNHMVGLSGAGARGYAEDGVGYGWILTHYYTGTKIEKKDPTRWIRIGLYSVS